MIVFLFIFLFLLSAICKGFFKSVDYFILRMFDFSYFVLVMFFLYNSQDLFLKLEFSFMLFLILFVSLLYLLYVLCELAFNKYNGFFLYAFLSKCILNILVAVVPVIFIYFFTVDQMLPFQYLVNTFCLNSNDNYVIKLILVFIDWFILLNLTPVFMYISKCAVNIYFANKSKYLFAKR